MLWMSLLLSARIEVYEADSEESLHRVEEAADKGAEKLRACGWGWASMRVVVDARGTTVEDTRGSSKDYIDCVSGEVTGWYVLVVEGSARLLVEANQVTPDARLDRELTVTVVKAEGVEPAALQLLIEQHESAWSACQVYIAGDVDYTKIEVSFDQKDGRFHAWASLPGPMGRCVEREVEPWKLAEGSGKLRLEYGKQGSLDSLLGP